MRPRYFLLARVTWILYKIKLFYLIYKIQKSSNLVPIIVWFYHRREICGTQQFRHFRILCATYVGRLGTNVSALHCSSFYATFLLTKLNYYNESFPIYWSNCLIKLINQLISWFHMIGSLFQNLSSIFTWFMFWSTVLHWLRRNFMMITWLPNIDHAS